MDKLVENKSLHNLHEHLERLKKEATVSQTAKLWLLFMHFVSIIRMLIRAETSGTWDLHLHATQLMFCHSSLHLDIITTQNAADCIYKMPRIYVLV